MIRPFASADLDSVMDIWLNTNKQAHPFIAPSYWDNHFDQVKAMLPLAQLYVYDKNSQLQGFIGMIEPEYVAGLFVASDFQHRGIGSKLLHYCQQHYSVLILDVYLKNESALHFYRKHGFQPIEKKQNAETKELEFAMRWSR